MTRKKVLLLFSSGGMMLSCLCTCTAFILASLSHKPVGAPEAAGILLLSTVITGCLNNRRWPRPYAWGLHTAGFSLSALWLCQGYYRIEASFWRFRWIRNFLMADRGAAEWFALISILLGAGILWFLGYRLVTRPVDRTTISHRFDIGLGFLLALLIIKLLIAVRGGSLHTAHSATMSIITFVILGLFSMGLVHIGHPSRTGGISYLKGVGAVMSFTASTLLLGGGLFLLFLPELQSWAGKGADMVRTAAAPLGPVAVSLLRFFLLGGCRPRSRENVNIERAPAREVGGGDELSPPASISAPFIDGLMIVAGLAVVGFLLLHLAGWLRSPSGSQTEKWGILKLWLSFVNAAKQFLFSLRLRLFARADRTGAAATFYIRFLNWGRYSGVRPVASETPREYAARLGQRFPTVKTEIYHVIHLHDTTLYGCIAPSPTQIALARAALSKMRHPRLWATRLKSLCFQNNI